MISLPDPRRTPQTVAGPPSLPAASIGHLQARQMIELGPMISLLDRRWTVWTVAGLSSMPAALIGPSRARWEITSSVVQKARAGVGNQTTAR
jgi:hypothetical protein